VEVSATIARHVAETRAEAIPALALAAARRSLLDAIGVSVAASGLAPECLPFASLAGREQAAPVCTILGFGERTSPAAAALVNGALAHALDFEDADDESLCHPNAQIVPVLLALAESAEGIGGRELLAAMAVGCDLTCRLALALGPALAERGWYPPSLVAGFGATAAAANLLRLDERRTLDAFSLVLGQVGSHGPIFTSSGTAMRGVRDAFGAHAALVSALLARDGLRGYDAPFEGPGGLLDAYTGGGADLSGALDELGAAYAGERVSFKPWPSCRATHPFVEGALALRAEQGLRPDQVAGVRLVGSPEANALVAEPRELKLRPGTVVEAKFSVYVTVALALEAGELGLGSFAPGRIGAGRAPELAGRIHFQVDETLGVTAGRIEITTTDGRVLAREVPMALGAPGNPLSDEQLLAKHLDCTSHAASPLEPATREELAKRILSIDEETDVPSVLIPLAQRAHDG
jgi:2-methylcitrate dehydratase PrpD